MDEDEKLAFYLEIGAIEVMGIEDDGEFIFRITDAAKELAPELWSAHEDYVNDTLLELYERGLINVSYDESLEAMVEVTPEGMQVIKKAGLINLEYDIEKE
jgi:hypothetical protein